jgi:nucleoside-diphosphate-sugar epimerase
MTAIVTGATGFIGRHLVEALAASGQEVRCLTRGPTAADSRPGVSTYRVDYGRSDLSLADHVLSGAETVFHLAGATRAVSAAAYNAANVGVTERLIDRLVTLGERPRFVLVSSQAAAGPARDAEHPKSETDPDAPIEDYGKSKLAAERTLLARGSDFPATVIRPVAVYGPGDRDFLSIFAMARRGLAVYPGIRHSSLNTVYVADLVAAMKAAAQSAKTIGKTYFLGDDAAHQWTEIYRTIAEVVGQGNAMEVSVPRGLIGFAGAIGDLVGGLTGKPTIVNRSKAILAMPKYWLCTSAAARRDFGFATPTSLRDGMRATYDWYVRNRWL